MVDPMDAPPSRKWRATLIDRESSSPKVTRRPLASTMIAGCAAHCAANGDEAGSSIVTVGPETESTVTGASSR